MGSKRSNEDELMEFSYKQPKLVMSMTDSYPCHEAVIDADVKGQMGTKRLNEELMEFPCKQPKLVLSLTDAYPFHEAVLDTDVKGKQKELEDDSKCIVSDSARKLLDNSSSPPSKEDSGSGSGITICSALVPPYFDFYYSPSEGGPKTYSCDDDNHSSILDAPPKKHIPLGPNHQATLPAWNPPPLMGNSVISDLAAPPQMGDVVISGLAVVDDVKVGEGKKVCYCNDAGSVNCVQKHIKEASDILREEIGNDKFEQLGLYGMGEEVALNWTYEEEGIFHSVIYGNPLSCGKDFWRHLSLAFPYRTKREIVSYYFNVFILRRRAVQNRSNFLDIDSDDDEWQGINVDDDEWQGINVDDDDNATIGISIDRNSESVAEDGKKQEHASFESQHNNFEIWNASEGEKGY